MMTNGFSSAPGCLYMIFCDMSVQDFGPIVSLFVFLLLICSSFDIRDMKSLPHIYLASIFFSVCALNTHFLNDRADLACFLLPVNFSGEGFRSIVLLISLIIHLSFSSYTKKGISLILSLSTLCSFAYGLC